MQNRSFLPSLINCPGPGFITIPATLQYIFAQNSEFFCKHFPSHTGQYKCLYYQQISKWPNKLIAITFITDVSDKRLQMQIIYGVDGLNLQLLTKLIVIMHCGIKLFKMNEMRFVAINTVLLKMT